ncbi:MAG: DUF4089 domain-containing protein [Parafilimonas terrae]|jgi:hypothetical protein|nr:DUF4089 domain-containing protein [Parafilimonas terrae]
MPDPQSSFDPDAYAVAASALLGVKLDADWLAPIAANLRVLAAAAELVNGFPLPDTLDAAPRFEA